MRKMVQVVGIGQRKAGLSKKGKKYDFTEISIVFPADGVTGMKAETIAFDSAVIGERIIAPGDTLDLVFHQSNFKTYVDCIVD
jgi:hypothetical protein